MTQGPWPPAPAVPPGRPPRPTGPDEREPILDVLRGFALLGILLINIELMRGADFYRAVGGTADEPAAADRVAHFLTGWLAAGKFLSSFAIMFGIGAALITARAWRAGRSPRPLLARRYGLLMVLGIAHMLLLFPGDILFVYGLTGMALLVFVGVRATAALWWSAGILSTLLVLGVGLVALGSLAPEPTGDDPVTTAMADFLAERGEQAVAAHQDGSYAEVVAVNAWEALLIQSSSLIILPWILALFLLGFALGRSGLLADLAGHRRRLRLAMGVCLPVGLVLNLPTGVLGPLSMGAGLQPGTEASAPVMIASTAGQIIGAPVLAVGYLSALALLCLSIGPIAPLAAVGRMALSAYLAQSVLALVVFAGLGLYDRLSAVEGLGVAVGIWAVLLVACPLWMRRFRFGPVEWLWRSLTYGRLQPMRGPVAAPEGPL